MSSDVLSSAPPTPLSGRYLAGEGSIFLTGTQALVRVIVDAMRRDRKAGLGTRAFVSGYPGSPLGGLDKELAASKALLEREGVVHLPGHNEELAATAIAGSQLVQGFRSATADGVVGVWYGKAPGLDRALDAIRHGQFAGVSSRGGVLMLVGDDPECKSSSLPSASEHTLASVDAPVLYPGTLGEVLELGARGVEISRASGLWTAMKLVSSVADGTGTVDLDSVGSALAHPLHEAMPFTPVTRTPGVPESIAAEQEILQTRIAVARQVGAGLNQITVDGPRATMGIVAPGPLYGELVEALTRLGLDEGMLRRHGIRLLRVRLLHPMDPGVFRAFATGLREILVIEEKRPMLEPFIRQALYGTGDTPLIVGRADERGGALVPGYGVLRADELIPLLRGRLERLLPGGTLPPPLAQRELLTLQPVDRTPFFCSGCPHNFGTRVPSGALVGGGIGCHAIARWAEPEMVGDMVTKTQMGGEGATWLGLSPFIEEGHLFQNMGDGTYFHSGQLAIQSAVAAGAHITFKLLYNSAIAMTGGQSPGESNSRPVPDVAEILLRQGVTRVLITADDVSRYHRVSLPKGVQVWPREKIIGAQELLRAIPGVTVLIHDQECAAERRRKRKRSVAAEPARRLVINERVCEGCGDCGAQSNCLSVEPVETEFGRKTRINQTSCNTDYSCLQGNCPSFVSVLPRRRRRRHARQGAGAAAASRAQAAETAVAGGSLPDPEPIVNADDFTVRMPGIGGTGVVTVSQILGVAAGLDGRVVRGLDQTGLSQKAGPVVSDVRVTSKLADGSNRAGRGSADLFLCFDEVVGLAPENLQTISRDRTVAVSSSSRTPTGQMITDVSRSLPDADTIERILRDAVGSGRLYRVDAQAHTRSALGSATCANVFLLGVAFQAGAIPLSAGAIEEAISLNGVAVAANRRAFDLGRRWLLAQNVPPPPATAAAAPVTGFPPSVLAVPRLQEAVLVRLADLTEYQDSRYAARYLDFVSAVSDREADVVGGGRHDLSLAVAANLHKLMAYKDEYEVARLHLNALAGGKFASDVRVFFNLEPPMLKALGYDHKVEVGPWFRHVFRVLRAGRRLRGSRLDPFGLTEVRRLERRLARDYVSGLQSALEVLTPDCYDAVCDLARLPDLVRGYEEVKLKNAARYDAQRQDLLQAILHGRSAAA